MTNTILTPYKLFFIDETNSLWALMKDGRSYFIKKTNAFLNISSDFKTLTSVQFNGKNTIVTKTTSNKEVPLASFFGYLYYPTLNKTGEKMALIRADLFTPHPYGELIIYQKFKKNGLP